MPFDRMLKSGKLRQRTRLSVFVQRLFWDYRFIGESQRETKITETEQTGAMIRRLLGDSDPECCGYMIWAVANWATRTPVYHKSTPSAHWNQSKHSANELASFYIFWVLCFAKGLCSEDGNNLHCWPFGLQPASLTSRSLSFLCFDWARTIIREGKAHCYILTDPRPGLKHSLGFCVGTAALPGQTV